MSNSKSCNLCKSESTVDFLQLPPVPTQDGNMSSTLPEALKVDKGVIDLRFCKSCGFICNQGYDASKITFDLYDFSNDQSTLYKKYVSDLVVRLTSRYQIRQKTILDIGCGDGVFLDMICKYGSNKGIGIDPGFDHSRRKMDPSLEIEFIRDYYDHRFHHLTADLIVCRLVYDLLDDQNQFLQMLRKNLVGKEDTVVYFEVPNAAYTFQDKVIWNVVYEHRAWYTEASLRFQFESCGFEVIEINPCWHDEFLGIEARPIVKPQYQSDSSLAIKDLEHHILEFEKDFNFLKEQSQKKIDLIERQGIKTIAWGAGARAVTFFNLFNLKHLVPYIVDINTLRQGKFLPGSGQEIVKPTDVLTYQPDMVIITNPTYEEEIKEHIKVLGLQPDFWVL